MVVQNGEISKIQTPQISQYLGIPVRSSTKCLRSAGQKVLISVLSKKILLQTDERGNLIWSEKGIDNLIGLFRIVTLQNGHVQNLKSFLKYLVILLYY